MNEFFGPIIHSFTRKDAIQTGDLVDVSSMGREAGIRFPVAITAATYQRIVKPDEAAKSMGESEEGRLWDVLYMFSVYARRSVGSEMNFSLVATFNGYPQEVNLNAVIGPGDDFAPVITIMLPTED
ncbi:hypothetical protein LCY76_23695 [Fictibacillus sp. KIGAM418]|uniref:Uncharacterized protein n=1 Tax=Fictibacillus marinisediminis TaxID=2878389 RepID=A0A9X1XG66_9BACL|nr:DUF6573 family protein [Fictibacillus marinisediminis]MCK6259576.1 hypothetical protein [Fictibacillus marinisediminis]